MKNEHMYKKLKHELTLNYLYNTTSTIDHIDRLYGIFANTLTLIFIISGAVQSQILAISLV